MYGFVSKTYKQAPIIILLSSILLIGVCIYIFSSIGHKKDIEGIYMNSLDSVSYEIVFIIFGCLMTAWICLFEIFAKMVVSLSSKMFICLF